MKKRLAALMCALLLLISGCVGETESTAETVAIYRIVKTENQTNGELLRAETVELQTGITKLNFILQKLQMKPEDASALYQGWLETIGQA